MLKSSFRNTTTCATSTPTRFSSSSTTDESQVVAVVYHSLRKIGPEGEILTYDVQDWWQILMEPGRKWFYPDNTCPNLLDENVDWRKLMGAYYEDIRHEPD